MALFAMLEKGVEVEVPSNKIDIILENLEEHIAKSDDANV